MGEKAKPNQEADHKVEILHKSRKVSFMINKNIKAQRRTYKK